MPGESEPRPGWVWREAPTPNRDLSGPQMALRIIAGAFRFRADFNKPQLIPEESSLVEKRIGTSAIDDLKPETLDEGADVIELKPQTSTSNQHPNPPQLAG